MPTFVLAFFMNTAFYIINLCIVIIFLNACKHTPPQQPNKVENTTLDTLEVLHPKIPVQSIEEGQCEEPLSLFSFNNALNFLKDAKSDAEKLKLAKELLDKNCLTAYQVAEFMEVISSDKLRLELAKHAYGLIYDPVNWSWLRDALAYEFNKESLDLYVKIRD